MDLQIKSFNASPCPLEAGGGFADFTLIAYSLRFCEHAATDVGAWRGMFWGCGCCDSKVNPGHDNTSQGVHTPSCSVM